MKVEWKTITRVGIGVFLLFLGIYYWKGAAQFLAVLGRAAVPLLEGCVIAYIVNILMSFYERHYFPQSSNVLVRKSARPVCMFGAFFTVLLVIVLLIRLVVPELVSCFQVLFAGVPKLVGRIADLLTKADIFSQEFIQSLRNVNWETTFSKAFQVLSSGIGDTVSYAASAVTSLLSSVVNLMIGVTFAIYLLFAKERLMGQCSRVLRHYVRPSWEEKLRYVLSVANDCFHRYLVGQCTEAVILGILCMVGMLIFKFPYAPMTGAVIGVTALIPVAGAYIGGAVGFLLIVTISPIKALLFLLYLVILQQLEGNLIYPKVVGSSMGLPGIWVLAAVTVGGSISGILGMLIGVPLAATLYQLLRNDIQKRERLEAAAQKKS